MSDRRGAEAPRAAEDSVNALSERVIGAAIEVHRHLGPGLLESIYEECLAQEFGLRSIAFQRQAGVIGSYTGTRLAARFRVDFVVGQAVMVALKAVEALQEIHMAQLLTCLRLGDFRLGLLMNFNVPAVWRERAKGGQPPLVVGILGALRDSVPPCFPLRPSAPLRLCGE